LQKRLYNLINIIEGKRFPAVNLWSLNYVLRKIKDESEAFQTLQTLRHSQTFQHAENTYGALTI